MPAVKENLKKLTSWSFSKWADYQQCPAKFKFKHLMGLKEPSNEAMERGTIIHQMAEDYTKGKLPRMPKELLKFKAHFTERRAQFKKRTILNIVEDQWAFTKTWARTKWDSWKDCWLRIKLDDAVSVDGETMVITDYKTGKFRTSDLLKYEAQLELYALAAFLLHPSINVVKSRLMFLDLGSIFPFTPADVERLTFHRKDLPSLKKAWLTRIRPLFDASSYPFKPSRLCEWCFFSKAKKGPCKH